MLQLIGGIALLCLGLIITTIGGYIANDGWKKWQDQKTIQAPSAISIPLVDLELKRVEAPPELSHLKVEFAYDIMLHNKSSEPISHIVINRQINPNKNKQKITVHQPSQSQLKPFQKKINVLGPNEHNKIHREHSPSYEYTELTVIYQDATGKRYKCSFEGDRDGVNIKNNCAIEDMKTKQ